MYCHVLFFFRQVLAYSKQFLNSIKAGHSKVHLFLLYLVSLSFSPWSQTQWDWDHHFQDSSEPFCLNQTHASHTIPGLVLLLLLTAHRTPWMGSNPVSELWACGLPYLVCFLKCSLFTRNLILLSTAGPLDISILFFNSAVISLFQCFF